MIEIRQCTLADLPYIYEICYLTGYQGGTVEGISDDKFKSAHYFAGPYVHFDREMCFVVTIDNIPKGYIIGTDNTEKYNQWLNKTWLPDVRKIYNPDKLNNEHPFEQFLNSVIFNETIIDDKLKKYPAHLHIDLLPELQGKGMGRKLMETFFDRCRDRGVKKIHLGVSTENPGACAFYKKIGMYVIYEVEGALMMGFDL